MAITLYKIKKWFRMMTGNSILHVNQGPGTMFTPGELNGYFNDLTEKVTRDEDTLARQCLPPSFTDDGKLIVFATTIFQYGLGAYDMTLKTGEDRYSRQFKRCVDWALENQGENGGWDISEFAGDDAPYGAMAQGEGASLLLRAYKYYGEPAYLNAARNAVDLMLTPLRDGGTAEYVDDGIILYEFTNTGCVLNGWIFALFGLYDLITVMPGEEKYRVMLDNTLSALKNRLSLFDNGYWSMYDTNGHITSGFYHSLHIAQLETLAMIDDDPGICACLNRFRLYRSKWLNGKRAFVKKVRQKIFE